MAPAEEERVVRRSAPSRQERDDVREDSGVEARVDEERAPRTHDALVIQAGSEFYSPSLQFRGVGTNTLRNYRSPMVIAPRLRAEIYPVAFVSDGAAAGLGLEFDYTFSVASRTRTDSGTPDVPPVVYPTSASRMDVGARFRIQPIKRSKFALTPFAGFRMASFSTGEGSDGTRLDGLPNIGYSALRLGGQIDVPVVKTVRITGDAAFLAVLSTGQIGSAEYFPNTAAQGFEANAGLGWSFIDHFEVRGAFNFTRYAMKFTPEAGATHLATGAVDQQMGASVALRYTY